jgi:hypothetical protein
MGCWKSVNAHTGPALRTSKASTCLGRHNCRDSIFVPGCFKKIQSQYFSKFLAVKKLNKEITIGAKCRQVPAKTQVGVKGNICLGWQKT